MVVVVGAVVPGLVRILMGMWVVVHRIPVAMFVTVDDDLAGGIAFGAVAGGDLAGSPALDAFFHAMGDGFGFHRLPLVGAALSVVQAFAMQRPLLACGLVRAAAFPIIKVYPWEKRWL
jgi:hypothetical protein